MENNANSDDAKASTKRWTTKRELTTVIIVTGCFAMTIILAGWLIYGWSLAEKSLKHLALPCGFVWLVMFGGCVWCWIRGQRILFLVCLSVFTLHGILGSQFVTPMFVESLEGQFDVVRPEEVDRFDVVVVLGGGVASRAPNHATLLSAGDRIALAAQLYHAGKVEQFIVTGGNFKWARDRMSPAEAASHVLVRLGVSESIIDTSDGRNTYEEFQKLKKRFENTTGKRIGILTSATHLPRAMRLAESVGVSVIPVPADFQRQPPLPFTYAIIPCAAGYEMSERSFNEYLAWIVGR